MIAEEDLASGRVLRLQATSFPIRHLSLALLTGGLLTLSFPGWEISILAWVALAPLLVAAARERSGARSFGLGLVGGTLFFYASSWWLTFSPINYGGFSAWLAYGLLLVPTIVSGLFIGLFALIVHFVVKRYGPTGMLTAPVVWVATEWLRLQLTGIGWNFLGYSQSFQPAMIQSASLGGVYTVSFLLALTSAALAYCAIAPSRKAAWRVLAGTLAILVVNIGYGAFVLWETTPARDGVPVVALQPNLPVSLMDADGETIYRESFGRLGRMGIEETDRPNAPALASPALLIWPEIPVAFIYDDDPELQAYLGQQTRRRGDYLLVNAVGLVGDGHTNSAMLIGPDGTRIGQYDKVRLLPFGEYVPFRSVIPFIDRVPALLHEFTPGTQGKVLGASGAQIGVSICFESAFPEIARSERRSGATAFVNITNDAWFGQTPEPRQHLAHAVMRSVENRTEQVRVTNAGFTARIDAAGRILDVTDLFDESTRRWILPTSPGGLSFYTRCGDWLPIACFLATIAMLVAPLARRKRDVLIKE